MSRIDPDELFADLEREVELTLDGYRWAHGIGYGASGTGIQERITGGDVSDPTYAATQGHRKVRREVRGAAHKVRKAITLLQEAQLRIGLAIEAADPRDDPLKLLEGSTTVTRAELREARAARDRRTRRGEGWGSA